MKLTIIFLALVCLDTNVLRAQSGRAAPGTLAYYLATNTAAYTAGHIAGQDSEWEVSGWNYMNFSGTNFFALSNAVWSSSFWLKGVQGLSATPIGISNCLAGQTLVTMISPRHYLRARHVGSLHSMAAFFGTNNIIYQRYSLEEAPAGIDTDVGILNADVPPAVGFLPVLPANYPNWLPAGSYVQGIGMNQGLELFGEPMALFETYVSWDSRISVPNGLDKTWNVMIRGGDSSNPAMLLINNRLVLVSHNLVVQGGPNYTAQIDLINKQMHYLSEHNHAGSDYQLTQFSLTNWPTIH
jgi:hypothetical protein